MYLRQNNHFNHSGRISPPVLSFFQSTKVFCFNIAWWPVHVYGFLTVATSSHWTIRGGHSETSVRYPYQTQRDFRTLSVPDTGRLPYAIRTRHREISVRYPYQTQGDFRTHTTMTGRGDSYVNHLWGMRGEYCRLTVPNVVRLKSSQVVSLSDECLHRPTSNWNADL